MPPDLIDNINTTQIEKEYNPLNNSNIETKKNRNTLWSSDVFKNALIENVRIIIFGIDQFGNIQLFNAEAVSKLEYTEEEIKKNNDSFLFLNQVEIDLKRQHYLKEYGVLLIRNLDVLTYFSLNNIPKDEDYTFISKTGIQIPVSLCINTVKDEDEKVIGFIVVATDISERKNMEIRISDLLKKEKNSNLLKSNFFSFATHEFKTPICAITSSVFLIQEYIKKFNIIELDNYLLRIKSSANLIANILDDFLQLQNIELGKVKLNPYLLNINELVNSIRMEFDNVIKQNITYEHFGFSDILIDGTLLKTVLINLIIISSKNSSDDLVIKIQTFNTDSDFVLVVKDFGNYYNSSNQLDSFDRFYQFDQNRNLPGFGFGLHVVAKYLHLMNGTLEYHSEIDKGTEFIIRFNNLNNNT